MLSKESALNDLDCVDKLLGMIAPILRDAPNKAGGDDEHDAAMLVGGSTPLSPPPFPGACDDNAVC